MLSSLFLVDFLNIMSNHRYGKEENSHMKYPSRNRRYPGGHGASHHQNYSRIGALENENVDENNEPPETGEKKKKSYSNSRITIAKPERPRQPNHVKPTSSSTRQNGGTVPGLDAEWPTLAAYPSEGRDSPVPSLMKSTQPHQSKSTIAPSVSPGAMFVQPPMPNPVKIIDESGSFSEHGIMEHLCDGSSNFLVVGVLGFQGCGKSSLMNSLANGCGAPGLPSNIKHFSEVSLPHILQNSPCTSGVDLLVTQERMVLLDSQALLTIAVADSLSKGSAVGSQNRQPSVGLLAPEYNSVESGPEMVALQTAAFMLSVCHVVLVMADQAVDLGLLKLLEMADMLRPTAPSRATDDDSGTQAPVDHVARLMFVHNKANRSAMTEPAHSQLTTTLSAILRQTSFRLNSAEKKQGPAVMCLPRVCAHSNDAGFSSEEWEACVQSLRRQLQGSSRGSLGATLAAGGGGVAGVNQFSEKRWIHFAGKTWDSIRKSAIFAEYHRLVT